MLLHITRNVANATAEMRILLKRLEDSVSTGRLLDHETERFVQWYELAKMMR